MEFSHNNIKVLIADDEEFIRESLSIFLEDEGYIILSAENGHVALEAYIEEKPDIILLDLRMPEMSGIDVIPRIKELNDLVPIIVISGNNEINGAVEALRVGAWDYITKPILDLNILLHRMNSVLQRAELLKENRRYQDHLETIVRERTRDLKESNDRLSESMFNTILLLTQTIEAKDKYTRGHCLRVSDYCAAQGRELGMTKKEISTLQLGGLLHDIGKIGIPGIILDKPGKLTDDEYRIIMRHPVIGENILKNVDYFKPVLGIIRHHHERSDTKGYPDSISIENDIKCSIVAVADVFDSLVTDRPYRSAMSVDEALEILEEGSGLQFSSEIVDLFISKKIYDIRHEEKLKIEFDFEY